METIVRVVVTAKDNNGLVSVGLPGKPMRHYLSSEAPSSAVCLALEATIRSVARYEVESGDGFTLKVVFVNEAGEPYRPLDGPGDAAFAEMEAVADAEDG